MFSKLFKPKWQHRDPEVRRRALLSLNDSDEATGILQYMVREDNDPALRQLAVKRLSDLTLLLDIATTDAAAEVRDTARQQYMRFFAGHESKSSPLEQRIELLQNSADDELIEYVARTGKEAQLRLAAVARVSRETLLGDLAGRDTSTEVRIAAAERLTRKSTLERVYEATRRKDKQVSRIVKSKLDEIVQAEEHPARVREQRQQLVIAMSALGRGMDWDLDEREYLSLEERWRKLEHEPEDEMVERYQKARDRFTTALAKYREAESQLTQEQQRVRRLRAEKNELLAGLEKNLVELMDREELAEADKAAMATRMQACREWLGREGAALEAHEARDFQTRLAQLTETFGQRERDLARAESVADELSGLCRQAEEMLQSGAAPLAARVLKDLVSRREKLPALATAKVREQVQRWERAYSLLEQRLKEQDTLREQWSAKFSDAVMQLERAIEKGEMRSAHEQRRTAQSAANELRKLGARIPETLNRRLNLSSRKISELDGWRSWAGAPKKERLCGEVEALIGSAIPPVELARMIQDARDDWKRIGPLEHDVDEALWERFNTACKRAYEPCEAYFTEQSNTRKANQESREALCQRLDNFISETDWAQADWNAVDALIREAYAEWRQLGPVDRARRKALQERFEQAIEVLRGKRNAEWETNRARKLALIEKVSALGDNADLRMAIDQAKQAQVEWKKMGRVSLRDERALWEQFHTACDRIFDRRRQEQVEQDEAQRALIDAKRDLITRMNTLAAAESAEEIRDRLAQLETEWRKLPAAARADETKFADDFRQARKAINYTLSRLAEAKLQQQLEALSTKAALCARVETLAGAGQTAEVRQALETVQAEWQALPSSGEAEAAISRRLQAATDAVADVSASSHAASSRIHLENLEIRERLCLRMEILAGVDSPAEAKARRMQYQVERLSESFAKASTAGQAEPGDELREIESAWYCAGPVAPEMIAQLEPRFQRAREAAHQMLGS